MHVSYMQNGSVAPPAQQPAAGHSTASQEPDLTQDQPGDAGYMAAVRAAMEQLSPGGAAGTASSHAAGASGGAAAAAVSADPTQAAGTGTGA